VAQKAVDLSHSINVSRKSCEEAKQRLANINNLHDAQAVAAEEVRGAKLTVEKYEAELAKLEAELAALLGKMPGKAEAAKMRWEFPIQPPQSWAQEWVIPQQQFPNQANVPQSWKLSAPVFWADVADSRAPQGSMADKIRKVLETPITIQIAGETLTDLMQVLQKRAGAGIVFRNVANDRVVGSDRLPLDLKEMPLATVLQAIADVVENKVVFVVRDYGILAVDGDHLPPGALRVDEFMKRNAAKDKPASGAAAKGKK
jgi:hypothetical protein